MAREPWKRVCTGGAESSEPLVWVDPAKGLGGATLVAVAPVVEVAVGLVSGWSRWYGSQPDTRNLKNQ